MIKGKDFILYLDDKAIAAAKNGRISLDTSFINVCSPVSGSFEEVLPTTMRWSVSTDGLISDPQYTDELMTAIENKRLLKLRFSLDGAGNRIGNCYISRIELTGSVKTLAKYTIELQGTGPIKPYGINKTFTELAHDSTIRCSENTISIDTYENDRIEYAEIHSDYPFKLVFEGTPTWFVMEGKNEQWEDEIYHLDMHGELNEKKVACGNGGASDILPAGDYVVYASEFELYIRMKIYK